MLDKYYIATFYDFEPVIPIGFFSIEQALHHIKKYYGFNRLPLEYCIVERDVDNYREVLW